jgi:hypothetical protein
VAHRAVTGRPTLVVVLAQCSHCQAEVPVLTQWEAAGGCRRSRRDRNHQRHRLGGAATRRHSGLPTSSSRSR